jgi:hypothetical protein
MTSAREAERMQIMTWLTGAAALGINLHALVALVRGLRASDMTVVARHARRRGWSAAGFALLLGAGLADTILTNRARQGDEPTADATRLATDISHAMNTTAFGVMAVVLPCIVAAVLSMRARRSGAART